MLNNISTHQANYKQHIRLPIYNTSTHQTLQIEHSYASASPYTISLHIRLFMYDTHPANQHRHLSGGGGQLGTERGHVLFVGLLLSSHHCLDSGKRRVIIGLGRL
jgi:hypothetical protein